MDTACRSPGCPNRVAARKWSRGLCDGCRTARLRARQQARIAERRAANGAAQRAAARRSRDARILHLYGHEGWTLKFIAREVGLSRERVRQIIAAARSE